MTNTDNLTPVEFKDGVWFKREDLFEIAGVCGGKSRTCWSLSKDAKKGLVTAGSRKSPQVNIVAHIAKYLGLPCHAHVPTGELSPEVQCAKDNGAEIIQHKAGYNNVIVARAREDAEKLGWTNIPFGMECREAIEQTRRQVANIPEGPTRIVIPVGSGMNLAGLLTGLRDRELNIPVFGVVVGKDPRKTLDKYAPIFWENMVELVPSGVDYHHEVSNNTFKGIVLDTVYEGKCIPFIRDGDLFWIVGIRKTLK